MDSGLRRNDEGAKVAIRFAQARLAPEAFAIDTSRNPVRNG